MSQHSCHWESVQNLKCNLESSIRIRGFNTYEYLQHLFDISSDMNMNNFFRVVTSLSPLHLPSYWNRPKNLIAMGVLCIFHEDSTRSDLISSFCLKLGASFDCWMILHVSEIICHTIDAADTYLNRTLWHLEQEEREREKYWNFGCSITSYYSKIFFYFFQCSPLFAETSGKLNERKNAEFRLRFILYEHAIISTSCSIKWKRQQDCFRLYFIIQYFKHLSVQIESLEVCNNWRIAFVYRNIQFGPDDWTSN